MNDADIIGRLALILSTKFGLPNSTAVAETAFRSLPNARAILLARRQAAEDMRERCARQVELSSGLIEAAERIRALDAEDCSA